MSDRQRGVTMLSVVVPVFNEVKRLEALVSRVVSAVQATSPQGEIVFVDDGSTAPTLPEQLRLKDIWAEAFPIRVVELSRNFGKEHAIVAGVDHVEGDAVVILDGDLQHPPERIPEMIELAQQGFDVVQARRVDRADEGVVKRIAARWFYWLFSKLTNAHVGDGLGDFILLNGRALKAFASLREQSRFNKGLYGWLGFQRAEISYEVEERSEGKSRWSFRQLVRFAIKGLLSFSNVPLRAILALGMLVSVGAIGFGFWIVGQALVVGVNLPGYTSIVFFVLFLGGVNLFCLGLVGAYVGEIFELVKERPLYVVRRLH